MDCGILYSVSIQAGRGKTMQVVPFYVHLGTTSKAGNFHNEYKDELLPSTILTLRNINLIARFYTRAR